MTPQEFINNTPETAKIYVAWQVTFKNGRKVDVQYARWVKMLTGIACALARQNGEIRPLASEIKHIEVVTLPADVIAFLEEEAHGPRGNAHEIETSVRQSMYKAGQLLKRYRQL